MITVPSEAAHNIHQLNFQVTSLHDNRSHNYTYNTSSNATYNISTIGGTSYRVSVTGKGLAGLWTLKPCVITFDTRELSSSQI